MRYDSAGRNSIVDEQIHGFKVNIKPEKRSKLSSVVLKIRGIDQVASLILFLFMVYFTFLGPLVLLDLVHKHFPLHLISSFAKVQFPS